MAPQVRVSKEQLERVCRMYRFKKDAAMALGIAGTSMSRLCRRHGIIPPWYKKKKP
jgi:transposase-like protein